MSYTGHFNPRSHEESDSTKRVLTSLLLRFQSTLSRRERPGDGVKLVVDAPYFNPRSHEESDLSFGMVTLTKMYFNPRSHEESDVYIAYGLVYPQYFNPRSHEESDLLLLSLPYTPIFNFNPRSHEESDCILYLTLRR